MCMQYVQNCPALFNICKLCLDYRRHAHTLPLSSQPSIRKLCSGTKEEEEEEEEEEEKQESPIHKRHTKIACQ